MSQLGEKGVAEGEDAWERAGQDCLTPIWLDLITDKYASQRNLDLTPMWLDSDDEELASEAPTQELHAHVHAFASLVPRELSLHLNQNQLYCRRTHTGEQ